MDKTWLDAAAKARAGAPQPRPGDRYRARPGAPSDVGEHLGDLLAEPDTTVDPFRPAERTYA